MYNCWCKNGQTKQMDKFNTYGKCAFLELTNCALHSHPAGKNCFTIWDLHWLNGALSCNIYLIPIGYVPPYVPGTLGYGSVSTSDQQLIQCSVTGSPGPVIIYWQTEDGQKQVYRVGPSCWKLTIIPLMNVASTTELMHGPLQHTCMHKRIRHYLLVQLIILFQYLNTD